MKNVFALRGKSNIGKSQTIRTVVEMLTLKHPDATVEYNHRTKVDERVVFTVDGLKIGIESQSNPDSRWIKESLDQFARAGCDVIICATRNGEAKVDENAFWGFDVQWLEQPEKSQPYEQVLRSLAMAREIVERVEVLIGSTSQPQIHSLSATA